ncbi:YfjI family protein [Novosphingobium percolationis]|uniref:YfjI family protein n=1 Tax=Novosphingobium percolationis TaxID=2871811 RepID=UPI001CD43866|nr:YfjI family protein [Novosphingobium percolationis]
MATNANLRERVEQAEPFNPWLDPLPLRDELPPVLAFEPNLLPGQLQAWVMDIAERMNCPADLVAIPAMVAAGALIGRKVGIRPQRRTDWLEVGNLWGCVIAPPGSLKSPAAAEALAPIRRLEAKAAKANEAALADFKAAETLFKLEKDNAAGAAKAALKDKDRGKAAGRDAALTMLRAIAEPAAPAMKRYLTSDGTAEKLGEICADNPDGILVHRDELLSLFADLDNPDKASARGFYLTGWGGQDAYTFDRIMRGTVRIKAVNLSVCGTTQPSRIAGYIRESLRSFDDGMVQRLQLLAWPDFGGEFREVDRYPDSEARAAAFECYSDLASMDVREIGAVWEEASGPDGVPYLRFADDAQDVFSEWRMGLEQRLRGDELPPAQMAHFAKYRGLVPRLALVCHLANNDFGPVSAKAIGQAIAWARYLESHAVRTYSSLAIDNADAARAIWRRIRKGDLPQPFTAREIQQKGWSGLTDKERVKAGLDALADASWLRGEKVETGGRPSLRYHVNPKALNA